LNDWYGVTFKTIPSLTDVRYEEMPLGPDNPNNIAVKFLFSLNDFMFPSNLENPDAVINTFAYWNLLSDESKNYYLPFEELVTGFAKTVEYAKDVDHIISNYMGKSGFIEDFYGYFPPAVTRITTEVFNKIATVNTTAASAVAALEYEVQSIIDNTLQ